MESILQRLWQHQRLRRNHLRTADGRRLVVLHPGFLNREAGPDFQQALLQFGDEEPCAGDVEVDREAAGWHQHHHEGNPAYRNVILHVLWSAEPASQAPCPSLALEPHLDSPLDQLKRWAGSEPGSLLPQDLRGQCAAPLKDVSPARLQSLLHRIAFERFRRKADWIQARAREAGWEQALWEAVFRCLGYKGNVWPMQRLAELLPDLHQPGLGEQALLARLLGVAGLLPNELPQRSPQAAAFLRQLWDHWWRVREDFRDIRLPARSWRRDGVRPANQPARRLAWAAHWLCRGDLSGRLQDWLIHAPTRPQYASTLPLLLEPPPDPFWSNHVSLTASPMPRPQSLLGRSRATDMAINAILPWLWMRAREGSGRPLSRRVEALYREWPPAQNNAVLRRARERLLGSRTTRERQGAAFQQGLLEILGSFCVKSDACCRGCEFPDQLRQWQEEGDYGD